MVSSDLSFAQDVVEDRCLHMMPYDDKYFSGVFEPGELLPVPRRSSSVMGRHNKRGVDHRHMPCMLKKIVKPAPLTPLRKQVKEKALNFIRRHYLLRKNQLMIIVIKFLLFFLLNYCLKNRKDNPS